jgi:Glycosyltransferase family 87
VLARALGAAWPDVVLLGFAAPVLLDAERWMTLTGNVAILDVPLAASAILLFHHRRLAQSAVVYGMMASFKLLPIVGLLAFPLVLTRQERPLRPLFAGVVMFAAIVLANLAIMGSTRAHYFTQLVGVIPGQYSASTEAGGSTDPNIVEFFLELSRAMGLTHQDAPVTAIAVLFLLLGASLTALRHSVHDDSLWKTRLFCAFVVVTNLALFRLKPYAFITLVPFLIVCCLTAGPRANSLLLIVALLAVPFAATVPLPRIARELHVPAVYTANLPAVGKLIKNYAQLCGLLILLGAILVAWHAELRNATRRAAEP